MTKFLHSKRLVCSVYRKSLKFSGKKLLLRSQRSYSSEAGPWRRLQNRCYLKDFGKLTRKNLYQVLYLMKLQALGCTFIAKESTAQMFSGEFYVIFKNTFFDELFRATIILVTLYQVWKWFCMVRKLWKPPSRKTYQNFWNSEGICGGVSL